MFSNTISEFFNAQLSEWELAGGNYRMLEKVKTRYLGFPFFDIMLQFNPERIKSSAAKTDAESVKARPCFLCNKNRPSQQRGISFDEEITVLVNPYPIFSRHLTIASYKHTSQRIRNNFGKMLSLAEALPDYVIFYNGPECGASAPDHFHLQAGNRGFMPIEKDFSSGRFTNPVYSYRGTEVWNWNGYLRGIISLTGKKKESLEDLFDLFYKRFSLIQPEKTEPMLNVIAYKMDNLWIIHIIPRKKHRPEQFFADGEDQILISPASVDLGGVVITPREEDFLKIRRSDIEDIFRQVCFGEEDLHKLITGLL